MSEGSERRDGLTKPTHHRQALVRSLHVVCQNQNIEWPTLDLPGIRPDPQIEILGAAMSDVPFTRKRFLEALTGISEGQTGAEELTKKLREALLEFGSETPDNLSCAEQIEVGPVGERTGLKLRSRDLPFYDIANVVEGDTMPEVLKTAFPDITQDEWDAFGRVTTLIYILLSRDRPH